MSPDPRVLITQLRNPESREKAARALEAGGEASVYQLLETLGDDDPDVRCRVVWVLEAIGSSAAVPGLVNSLDDPDPAVRAAILYALKRIGGSLAVDGVRSALNDADSNVRREAARALGEMGDVLGIAPLLAALSDADDNVARSAAASLGQIGGAGASRGLVRALNDHRRDVKVAAIRALGELEDPAAMRWIEPLTRHPDQKTQMAAREVATKLSGDLPSLPPRVKKLRQQQRFQARVRRIMWMVVLAVPVFIVGATLYSFTMENISVASRPTEIRPTLRPTQSRAVVTDKTGDDMGLVSLLWETKPVDTGAIITMAYAEEENVICTLWADDSQVMFWDATTGVMMKEIDLGEVPRRAALSEDCGQIAAGWDRLGVTIFDLSADQGTQEFENGIWNGLPSTFAWDVTGDLLASGSERELAIWSNSANEVVSSRLFDFDPVGIAFSPDGNSLAVASDQGGLYLINQAERGAEPVPLGQSFYVSDLILWDGASSRIAAVESVMPRDQIKVWNVQDGTLIGEIEPDANEVSAISWSPDGQMMAVAGDSRILLYATIPSSGSFELIGVWHAPNPIVNIEWSDNGETMIVGDAAGGLHALEVTVEQADGVIEDEAADIVASMEPLPGGALGLVLIEVGIRPILDVAFSPSANTVLSLAEGNYRVIRWDAATGSQVELWGFEPSVSLEPQYAAFSMRGDRFAVADLGGNISIWDIRPENDLTLPHSNQSIWGNIMAWSPADSATLAAAEGKEVGVRDYESGESMFWEY